MSEIDHQTGGQTEGFGWQTSRLTKGCFEFASLLFREVVQCPIELMHVHGPLKQPAEHSCLLCVVVKQPNDILHLLRAAGKQSTNTRQQHDVRKATQTLDHASGEMSKENAGKAPEESEK